MLDSDWLIAVIFFLLFGSGNFSSLDWYFLQIPLPNMIYLYKNFFLWCCGHLGFSIVQNIPTISQHTLPINFSEDYGPGNHLKFFHHQ